MHPVQSITATNEVDYPSLLNRIQTAFIDGIVTFTLIAALMTLSNGIDAESGILKVFAVIIGASYEPMLSWRSTTLGQLITGIRVRAIGSDAKPALPWMYLRYIVKLALGWISFLTIHSNSERRAIHDFAAGTMIVYRD